MKQLFIVLAIIISCTTIYAQQSALIRVMTYNVNHGQSLSGEMNISDVPVLLAENNIDIAALQQIDRHHPASNNMDMLYYLFENTEMYSSYGKTASYDEGESGNAFFTGYEVIAEKTYIYGNVDEINPGMLQTEVNVNGERIILLNIIHEGAYRAALVNDLNEILSVNSGTPVIMAGTIDFTSDSTAYKMIKNNFVDVWEYLQEDSGFTYPSDNPSARNDFIFISTGTISKLSPVSIQVLNNDSSTHLPVVAELRLN